jgi:hypothetical protein
MSPRNRIGRNSRKAKSRRKRVDASVLVAAAALLATSLGVSVAVAEEHPTSAQNSGQFGADKQPVRLAETIVRTPTIPTVHPTIHNQGTVTQSNQAKGTLQSNQAKIQSNQAKVQSNQAKVQSNQIKINTNP